MKQNIALPFKPTTLKIFFSTLFDQPTYPSNIFMQNEVAIGNRHMGRLTLLDFLELHPGLAYSSTNKN